MLELNLWCSSASTLLLTAFCFNSEPAMAVAPTLEATRMNTFLSGVIGGGYAAEAVSGILEEVPLVHLLPLEFLSLEDEFTEFIQKESSRYARNLVREQVGSLGLHGPLSLTSYSSPGGGPPARPAKRKNTRLRARISNRQMGLSLLFRF